MTMETLFKPVVKDTFNINLVEKMNFSSQQSWEDFMKLWNKYTVLFVIQRPPFETDQFQSSGVNFTTHND